MMISLIKYSPFLLLYVLFSLSCSTTVSAKTQKNSGDYKLSLSFNLENNLLTGTARITLQPGPRVSLSVAMLTVTGTLLKDQNGREQKLFAVNDRVAIPPRIISSGCTGRINGLAIMEIRERRRK